MKQTVGTVHTHTHTQVNLINKLNKIKNSLSVLERFVCVRKIFLRNNRVRDG